MNWTTQTWPDYIKHKRVPGLEWDDILEITKDGRPARYGPDIDDNEQEHLERLCVNSGTLIRELHARRSYYMDMERDIGASRGRKTSIVYAEWKSTGEIHGRPITEMELREKLRGTRS